MRGKRRSARFPRRPPEAIIAGMTTLTPLIAVLLTAAPAGEADAFRAAMARLWSAHRNSETGVVRAADGRLFLAAEFRAYSVGPFWGDHAAAAAASKTNPDPLAAIRDFAGQCKAAGADLIVVPVPGKVCVHGGSLEEVALPAGARPDAAHRRFLSLLEKDGIAVIDLLPDFVEMNRQGADPYCRQDSHWSPAGMKRAAERIAEAVRARPAFRDLPFRAQKTAVEPQTVEAVGDLMELLGVADPPKEKLAVETVRINGAFAEPDGKSPLVLAGDSHTLVYSAGLLAGHAGLPDRLAADLAVGVDLVGVMGSGANGSRITLARRRDDLAGKKIVVWVFAAREFTESPQGWQRVPVVRQK